ncbi:cytosine/adenosine deaminase-related metal-dependent hydrolase [Stackebrandtia endophytica]|uniref:Cytosine/adenosine deaminase-related metal-dependent hydrolase n=1 Tax=Stackebrandtia endophytica TaxID=1496996 RepID=A0A543AUY8_9ACTN|nr:amidohydrolase family protein [Stackebrandtia endophytica]TQL76385.1 cytosine/adenosine deaminase-related metal-dependent hydrolase [Stackebrandtia endophytica]
MIADPHTTVYRAPVVLPIAAPAIRDGAVAVTDGRISAVGPAAAVTGDEVVEFEGVLTPGLVNAHTHLCFSAYADHYGNGKQFDEWIQDFAPRNAGMTDSDWHDSIHVGVNASLRAGVTGIADVVTPPAALEPLLASGLAGTVYFEAVFIDKLRWEATRADYLAVVEAALAGGGADPLVGISPHTLYTLDRQVGVDLASMARERGLRLHPHLAESLSEDVYVREGTGPFAEMHRGVGAAFELPAIGGCGTSPTTEMDKWGLLGADSHVAHGVHLDADDRAVLRDHGTHVALCPRSNARLDVGEAPVAAYRAEGNPVAVGTDSLASAPDLDIAGELPHLRRIALAQGDSGEGLDRWLVTAATRGGALAMGRDDFGVLAPGARADLAVFDVDTAGDPYSAIVSEGAGSCIATVLTGTLMRHQ